MGFSGDPAGELISAGVLPLGPIATPPGDAAIGPPAGANELADGPPAGANELADGPPAGANEPAVGPPATGANELADGLPAGDILPDGPPAAGEKEPGVLVDGPFATGDIAGVIDPPVPGAGGDTVEPEGVGDEVGDLPVGVEIGAPLGDDAPPGVDDPVGGEATGELPEGADGVPGVDDPLGGEAAGEEPPEGGDGGDPDGAGVVDPLLGGAATGAGVFGLP